MGVAPRNLREFMHGNKLKEELTDVVNTHLDDKFKRLFADFQGRVMRPEDHKTIIIAMAMRYTNREIVKMVNESREADGLTPCLLNDLGYYRRKYQEIIDEVYIQAGLRIGEIYSLADKMVRIARYNEIGEAFRDEIMKDFDKPTGIDDFTVKKSHLYLKILSGMNTEMGAMPMAKMLRPSKIEEDEPLTPEEKFSKAEMAELVKSSVEARYKNQLPQSSIEKKLEFTDYKGCYNGEMLGEVMICNSSVMTHGNAGSQCPIQSGECNLCTQFLNRSLLENAEWLKTQRERRQMISDIAAIVGCKEYNGEIKEVVAQALKNAGVYSITDEKEEKVEEVVNQS